MQFRFSIYLMFNFKFLKTNFYFPCLFILALPTGLIIIYNYHSTHFITQWTQWDITSFLSFLPIPTIYYPATTIVKEFMIVFPLNFQLHTASNEEDLKRVQFHLEDKPVLFFFNFKDIVSRDVFTVNIEVKQDVSYLEFKRRSYLLTAAYYTYKNFHKANNFGSDWSMYINSLPIISTRPYPWPGIYCFSLYNIVICFILNFDKLDRLTQDFEHSYSHSFLKISSIFLIYNFIGLISHLIDIRLLFMSYPNSIIFHTSFINVFIAFTLSYNTALTIAMFFAAIPLSKNVKLHFVTILFMAEVICLFIERDIFSLETFRDYILSLSPMNIIFDVLNNIEFTEFLQKHNLRLVYFDRFFLKTIIYIILVLLLILGFTLIKRFRFYSSKIDTKNIRIRHSLKLVTLEENNLILTFPIAKSKNFSMKTFDKWKKSINRILSPQNSQVKLSPKSFSPSISQSTFGSGKATAIMVRGVYKEFYDPNYQHYAVKDFNMTAPENSAMAIIGASGSGKTTLIKLLAGKMKPTRGTIQIYGEHIDTNNKTQASKISVFLEGFELIDFLTVKECFRYIGINNIVTYIEGFTLESTIKLIAKSLNITSYMNHIIYQLPHLILHKVYCGIIFMMNRPLMLFDNPYRSLDIISCQCFNKLVNIFKTSSCIIITTTDSSNIINCVDKVLVINHGTSVFQNYINYIFYKNTVIYRVWCQLDEHFSNSELTNFVISRFNNAALLRLSMHVYQINIKFEWFDQFKKFMLEFAENVDKIGVVKFYIYHSDLTAYLQKVIEISYRQHRYEKFSFIQKLKKVKSKHKTILKPLTNILLLFVCRLNILFKTPMRTTVLILSPILTLIYYLFFIGVFRSGTVILNDLNLTNEAYLIGVNDSNYFEIISQAFKTVDSKKINVIETQNINHFVYDHGLDPNLKGLIFVSNKTVVYLSNYESVLTNILLKFTQVLFFGDIMVNSIQLTIKRASSKFEAYLMVNMIMFLVLMSGISCIFFIRTRTYDISESLKQFGYNSMSGLWSKYMVHFFLMGPYCSYIILIFYFCSDLKVTNPYKSPSKLFWMIIVFVLADVSQKLSVLHLLHYRTSLIFFMISLDCFGILHLIIVEHFLYLRLISRFGYLGHMRCVAYEYLTLLFAIVFPSTNLYHGLFNLEYYTIESIYSAEECINREHANRNMLKSFPEKYYMILLVQCTIYTSLYVILNNPTIIDFFGFIRLKYHLKPVLNQEDIVTFSNVTYYANPRLFIKNFNYTVKLNKMNLIIGPIGTGKTLISELMIGNIKPQYGAVFHFQSSIVNAKKKMSFSYFPSRRKNYDELTVKELFDFWYSLHEFKNSSRVQIFKSLLLDIDAGGSVNRLFRDLSETMKSKLLIALTILDFSDLIVFDDPFAGMDLISQRKIMDLMNLAIKEHGSTIVINTTNIALFHKEYFDYILVLHPKEKLIFSGKWTEIPLHVKIGYILTIDYQSHNNFRTTEPIFREVVKSKFPGFSVLTKDGYKISYFFTTNNWENVEIGFEYLIIEDIVRNHTNGLKYNIQFNYIAPD